ncbi:MAG: 2-oxoglutarate dehydrogenase E1 component, partial [Verrucomicrobia bacterium]|nr:2-oxoglutarate dehydrogenase E1 component [Verrucomicrobiota bacterium]
MNFETINASNLLFVEELYERWQEDHASVPVDWQRFFENEGPPARPHDDSSCVVFSGSPSRSTHPASHADKQSRVDEMIWAFRDVGYLHADLNPLHGYVSPALRRLRDKLTSQYEPLTIEAFGLREDDLDLEFVSSPYLHPPRGKLRDIFKSLQDTYCSAMGVEIMHIQHLGMRRWLTENIEQNNNHQTWSVDEKQTILKDLIRASEFESFLHSQFVGQKRFSIEGSESLIPALRHIIYQASFDAGIEEIVLGMSHRGRLNVLGNVVGKPFGSIFSTFSNDEMPFEYTGSGDVRYHLGYSTDHTRPDGRSIHIGLVANPSHLEAVDTIVQGKTRGIQQRRGDRDRSRVMPILIHGDAAFAGQGVVAEVFNMSQLAGYHTGGTIHIIVNNQIGFTTGSGDARSTIFPTDVAKSMPVPIFHVNGNNPEQVVRAMNLAVRFRQEFKYDAVIDIMCYRKHGHNESDDPTFTHPVMYEYIKNAPSAIEVYGQKLHEEGTFSRDDQQRFRASYIAELKEAVDHSDKFPAVDVEEAYQGTDWSGFTKTFDHTPVLTGVPLEDLHEIAEKICTIPESINVHKKLERIIGERRKRYAEGKNIDWSSAEALAFASLLVEGTRVRLSGEDSGRGTFSQRHAIWWHLKDGAPVPYQPFNAIAPNQARFCVYDSPLSEYSVLGFDFGYSIAQPKMLILWEAQFGDFCNGAQVVIDQFIAAAETKWDRSSGLVMLLPHGYSGQGPEHSSAHMERFLQLCAEDNIQVCNPSTPAQYFHMLRRQMKRKFLKPLIVMTPKSLLRHPKAVSTMEELSQNHFLDVIPDAAGNVDAENLLLCSGQIYYDLEAKREALGDTHTAIIRVEQLYPFPTRQLQAELDKYRNAAEVVWVQEESRNRGAWHFLIEEMREALAGRNLRYVGRPASASPATGSFKKHMK